MKKLLLILLTILIVAPTYSQKKGKDDLVLEIDSLTKKNNLLTNQLDSVSKERDLYYGVYAAIKDEIIKYDFDPLKTSFLIDSLKNGRESISMELIAVRETYSDSLTMLKTENLTLKSTLDTVQSSGRDSEEIVAELKQLKELLDAMIITQDDFNAKKTKLMEQWE